MCGAHVFSNEDGGFGRNSRINVAEDGSEQEPNGMTATKAAGGVPSVFISYASQDKALADAVCEVLEREGIGCWIAPRDVTPGEYYADAIVRALNEAQVLLLILTEHAIASPHVLREVERTSSKRHPIISLRIGAVLLPPALEYFLSASHWLEANPADVNSSFPKLLAAAKRMTGAAAASLPFPETKQPLTAEQPRGRTPIRALAWIIAVAVGLLFAAALVMHWIGSPGMSPPASAPTASVVSARSVAVLPFVDMSEKKDQEYFSDGLSEELIDRLAHAKNLKVIARTSSFQFKGKSEDMRTIGQSLGVANLLEGSVRTSGSTIRVTAQLISVADGTHVWSETYDRTAGDIFKVQDEIAAAVVSALKVTMAPASHSDAAEPNVESHNKVLLAKYFNYRNTQQDSDRALAAIDDALKIQPDDAKAWVTLSDIYFVRAVNRWMPSREAYAGARKSIDRALEIDPNLAAAHRALGSIEKVFNNNEELYHRETQLATELDPSIGNLLTEAIDLYQAGNVDAAMPLFRQAAEVNPLDIWTLAWMANGMYANNKLAEAEKTFGRILELQPEIAGTYCPLGRILLADHKPAAALDAMRKEPDEANRLTCMPSALWALGRREEADTMLAQAEEKYQASAAYGLAYCYVFRGERDKAFKWLNRAYDNQDLRMQFLNEDPDFRSLHSDPRFAALERKRVHSK
jgi:adenylate cyclase